MRLGGRPRPPNEPPSTEVSPTPPWPGGVTTRRSRPGATSSLAAGYGVDWTNVGVVKELDDARGTATVTFTNPHTGTASATCPGGSWYRSMPPATCHSPQPPSSTSPSSLRPPAISNRPGPGIFAAAASHPKIESSSPRPSTFASRRLADRLRSQPPRWLLDWLGRSPGRPDGRHDPRRRGGPHRRMARPPSGAGKCPPPRTDTNRSPSRHRMARRECGAHGDHFSGSTTGRASRPRLSGAPDPC